MWPKNFETSLYNIINLKNITLFYSNLENIFKPKFKINYIQNLYTEDNFLPKKINNEKKFYLKIQIL